MDDTHADTTPPPPPPSSGRARPGRLGLVAGGLVGLGFFVIGLALGSTPSPTRTASESAGLAATTTTSLTTPTSTIATGPADDPTVPSTTTTQSGALPPSVANPSTSNPANPPTTTTTSPPTPPTTPPTTTTTPTTPTTPTPTTTPSVPPVEIVGPEEPDEPTGPTLTIVTVPAGILAPKLQFPTELAFGAQFVANIHISNPGIVPVSWTPGPGSAGVSWSTAGGTVQPGTGMTVKIYATPTTGPWTAQASLRYGGKDHPIALSGFHLGPQADTGVKLPMP
jgi:hypothetical protein